MQEKNLKVIEKFKSLVSQKGDYMEQAEVTQKDVDEILPEAINFVGKIKEYLLKTN